PDAGRAAVARGGEDLQAGGLLLHDHAAAGAGRIAAASPGAATASGAAAAISGIFAAVARATRREGHGHQGGRQIRDTCHRVLASFRSATRPNGPRKTNLAPSVRMRSTTVRCKATVAKIADSWALGVNVGHPPACGATASSVLPHAAVW